jgi:formylmethanofuran dehydrogenase subunit B
VHGRLRGWRPVDGQVLDELKRAKLCKIPSGMVLTSQGVKTRQSTMGTLLVSAVRRALQVRLKGMADHTKGEGRSLVLEDRKERGVLLLT